MADALLVAICGTLGAGWGWVAVNLAARAARPAGGRKRAPPDRTRRALGAVLTAGVFTGCALRFGATPTLAAELVFVAGAVLLAWCDGRWWVLPTRAIYATLSVLSAILVLSAWADHEWWRLVVSAACGLTAFGLLFLVNAANPRWLAFGDVRFALLVGVALGWVGLADALVGFLAANLLGLLVGVVGILRGRMRVDSPLPFGLFLAAGAVIALLVR